MKLRVDFAMNIDGDNFNQPSFGFRVIAGPSQQVSQSVNGKSSFEKIYSIILYPIKRKFYNQAGHHWI
jgi:hypothetical protein